MVRKSVVVALLLMYSSAFAMNGNDWRLRAESTESWTNGFAFGMVQQYVDEHPQNADDPNSWWGKYAEEARKKDPKLWPESFCIPAGVSRQQSVKVIFNWMDRNPARTNEQLAEIIRASFVEAWPCPKLK